jgi:sensor histidine kinase regulating citrate/malate metabolism
MDTTATSTPIVEKLVAACHDREAFWQLISGLDPKARVTIHDHLWETLIETSQSRNRPLTRDDITLSIQPSVDYQRRMGCTEPVYVCRRKTCINSNPICVSQKVSEHIEVIRQHLAVQQSS